MTSSGLHLSSVGEENQIASGELPNLAPLANPWLLWVFFSFYISPMLSMKWQVPHRYVWEQCWSDAGTGQVPQTEAKEDS